MDSKPTRQLSIKMAQFFRLYLKERGWVSNGSQNPELWRQPSTDGKRRWYNLPNAILIARSSASKAAR